jgi:hypothetical protein
MMVAQKQAEHTKAMHFRDIAFKYPEHLAIEVSSVFPLLLLIMIDVVY